MDNKQISQIAIGFQQWILSLCEQIKIDGDSAIKEAQAIIDDKN